MADVIERKARSWFFRRQSLGPIIVCILAYGASSMLPYRTLSHSVSTALGVAMVLFAVAPALREISDSVQRWTMVAGSLVLGAAVGLVIRLITR
jgi:putative effector of murein hydrolase